MDLPGLVSGLLGVVEELDLSFEAGSYPAAVFDVLSFRAREALSEPFEVEVELAASRLASIDEEQVIGQAATFSAQLKLRGQKRVFHGVVAEFYRWTSTGNLLAPVRYRARLRPTFWTLQHTRRHRFFEDADVVDIVKAVLDGADVPSSFINARRYQRREYTVQYGESDFDFVSRLLEEEGLRYYFHHDGQDIMVISDGAPPALPGEPGVPFRAASNLAHPEDAVTEIERTRSLGAEAVFLRDYQFIEPDGDMDALAPPPPKDHAGPATPPGGGPREVYEYPGRYQQGKDAVPLALVRLQELRCRTDLQRGHATVLRFAAGHHFGLHAHPVPSLNGDYHLIETVHTGTGPRSAAPAGHGCEFVSIPTAVPFRPRRATARPAIPGTLTAVVVGPENEEIYTDEFGRVKVQFHWDRVSERDDHSSCWIRVAQSWAGQGWGALYLPRVGQEVVVTFLDGDPDRPLIIGSTYNGNNPPPVVLPGDKSRSTLRSSSTPGGKGSNEIAFEDEAGKEKLYVHAQKDLDVTVEHDRSLKVTGHEKTEVKKDRKREVGGNHTLIVHQNDKTTIDLAQSLSVGQGRTVKVGADQIETIGGTATLSVGGARIETVALDSTETVGQGKSVSTGGEYHLEAGSMVEQVTDSRIEEVAGGKTVVIGGLKKETVTGDHQLHVLGDSVEKVDGKLELTVTGPVTAVAHETLTQTVKEAYKLSAKEITFEAKETFVIAAGANKLTITKDGDIKLNGKKLEISATGELTLKGQKLGAN